MRIDHVRDDIERNGFAEVVFKPSKSMRLELDVQNGASQLGKVVAGRSSRKVETLSPQGRNTAHLKSLSAVYGKASLPLHVDQSHRPTPCRYIVMTCVEASSNPANTILLSHVRNRLNEQQQNTLRESIFFIRNGRNSFYSSALNQRRGFIRWDPACMEPQNDAAFEAAEFLGTMQERHPTRCVEWTIGKYLIIDNWRCLHGRSSCHNDTQTRTLLRVSVT